MVVDVASRGIRAGKRIAQLTVRPAVPADAERVQQILAETPRPRPANLEELSSAFADNPRNDGTGEWVIEARGEEIGYLSLGRPSDDEIDAL